MDEKYSILIVDDDEGVCRILHDLFVSLGYWVRVAHHGEEALRKIDESRPNLVVSDIQMPVMDGFELFRILEERFPLIKHVLMTSYNIDKYLSLIRKHNIGNILVKGSEFNIHEVGQYIHTLLTGDIFGLDRYFPGTKTHSQTIDSYPKAKEISSIISRQCPPDTQLFLEIAIDELISNAVFHGVLELTGVPRELWRDDYVFDAQDGIKVSWASDLGKIGVAVEDPKGNLKKIDVLKWLDQTGVVDRGPEEHGRGFLLVRKLIDRFIINIDPGKRTECILLQYYDQDHVTSQKPLLIHEL